MKLNKFLILLLSINSLFAQMQTTATLQKVANSGFHRIILSPEIRSYSKQDLSDIRIFDANNIELPYFIMADNTTNQSSNFEAFTFITKKTIPNKSSTILFKNSKQSVNEIVASISNTEVVKSYNLSGSDDQNEWYGLINKGKLDNLSDPTASSVFKKIAIPNTNYKFLKIEFDDTKTLPINVLNIGTMTYVSTTEKVVQEKIATKKIKITEDPIQKLTKIHIALDRPQQINQIHFSISEPEYYIRKATLYKNRKRKYKKKITNEKEYLADFTLNSKLNNTISLFNFFEKDFYIEIDNQDNTALSIDKLSLLQDQIALIAKLDSDKKYIIKTGNKNLTTPVYDIENFKSEIPNELPEAKVLKVSHEKNHNAINTATSFWQKPWFMWMCISVGAIVLFYFSATLVKDMKNNS
ncbi:hypothetical protein [Flavobacterium algicola]|uniref:hypothetical protein n=1 Tax=Flavobacterium algicola TaxID=556529 RepID=UPI001EFEAF6D|nr:hypothetical protein [Flavobacterium algicola]MCG9793065.1 hypothetical protein [Flavobacterium algicola]